MKKLALMTTALLGLFACGDDGGTVIDAPLDAVAGDGGVDAPAVVDARVVDARVVDAAPSTVMVVTCPAQGGIASEVTAPNFAFTITDATITTGDIVRFTMPGSHNAASGTVTGGVPAPDGKFIVGFGATVCLQFTAPGTFPFYCEPHQFTGTLTVSDPV